MKVNLPDGYYFEKHEDGYCIFKRRDRSFMVEIYSKYLMNSCFFENIVYEINWIIKGEGLSKDQSIEVVYDSSYLFNFKNTRDFRCVDKVFNVQTYIWYFLYDCDNTEGIYLKMTSDKEIDYDLWLPYYRNIIAHLNEIALTGTDVQSSDSQSSENEDEQNTKLLQVEGSLLIRTNFSNDTAWQNIIAAIESPANEFPAGVHFVDNQEYEGLDIPGLLDTFSGGSSHGFAFLVDQETLSNPDYPVLVVDLVEEPGRSFRVIPSELWAVESNLSISNMDWEDFSENTDKDGIFRG